MPFMWGTIANKGQIFGNRDAGSFGDVTNGRWFSYPGYSEFLTGHPDDRITSNKPIPNPNVNVLEWLNGRPGFAGKVFACNAWERDASDPECRTQQAADVHHAAKVRARIGVAADRGNRATHGRHSVAVVR